MRSGLVGASSGGSFLLACTAPGGWLRIPKPAAPRGGRAALRPRVDFMARLIASEVVSSARAGGAVNRIAVAAAYHAICSTLPEDASLLPAQRCPRRSGRPRPRARRSPSLRRHRWPARGAKP
jgi:hypothetical protein